MSPPPLPERNLTAYQIGVMSAPIEPAPALRPWMGTAAKRCLPLVIANQAGWHILNDRIFRAVWDGGFSTKAVKIEYHDGGHGWASSHFGDGILTFNVPYIFRTSAAYNLLARGPANMPKDGISALEGLVETDWLAYPFTMNWKFTRPGAVVFDVGEPVCMIVPQQKGDLEGFETLTIPLADAPDIEQEYNELMEERDEFVSQLYVPGSEAGKIGWLRRYFERAQKKLTLESFTKE